MQLRTKNWRACSLAGTVALSACVGMAAAQEGLQQQRQQSQQGQQSQQDQPRPFGQRQFDQQQQQQQQRPGQAQQGDQHLEAVWRQAAIVHRQLIQMQVAKARQGDAAEQPGTQRPGLQNRSGAPNQPGAQNQQGAQDRPRAAGQPGVTDRPQTQQAQQPQRNQQFGAGQQAPSRAGGQQGQLGRQAQVDTVPLWQQLGQMHQQLVELKLKEEKSSNIESEVDRNSAGREQNQGEQQSVAEQLRSQARNQENDDDDDENSEVEQLRKRMTDLYGQILDRDIAAVTGARERHDVARPEFEREDEGSQNQNERNRSDRQQN